MIDGSNKIIAFSEEARELVRAGVIQLSDAVKVTMGPSGKNVLIEQEAAPPILTKDGVTVARAINLKDRFANLGVCLVREAAQRTAEEAGDGTTTATVLASAIFQEGLKALAAGHELNEIRSGIRAATSEIVEKVQEQSSPVKSDKDLRRVANISVNGETGLADLIVDALGAVGTHGGVTVDEAKGFESSLEVVEGCELDRGYVSPYFVNRPSRMCCELENPAIFVTTRKVHSMSHILHFLEEAAHESRPFVVISPETGGDALQGLILNHSKNLIKACVLAAPEFGDARLEALHDLAILLGTTLITDDPSEWKQHKLASLGRCDKLLSYRYRSVFIGAKGTETQRKARVNDILELMNNTANDSELFMSLERRCRRMNSGIGILRIGGATEAEIRERKDRVDDALYATRAAVEEGVVLGGGAILARCGAEGLARLSKKATLTSDIGEKILYSAAQEPLKQIARNCGAVPEVILAKMLEKQAPFGYNGVSNKICNLQKEGIIDPAKVTRLALINASSCAINLLSIGCAMIKDDSEI
jgi:chaperonin GroEL